MMWRPGLRLAVLLLLAAPAAATDEPIALGRYVTMLEEKIDLTEQKKKKKDVDEPPPVRRPLERNEMAIDHSLIVVWDEAALRADLVDEQEVSPATLRESRRLETLRDLVVRFLEVQVALAEARALGPGGPRASVRSNEANERFGAAAVESLEALQAHLEALEQAGRTEEMRRLERAANDAVLEDYRALADVIRGEIEQLEARVRAALDGSTAYQVQMRATLVASTGRRRLHLVGYDRISEFDATETPRYQFGLDQRAEAEVRAAEQLGNVVRQALDGTLGRHLREAREAIVAELKRLAQTMEADVLEGNLRRTIEQIEASGEARFDPVRRQAEELLATVQSLSGDVPPFDTESSAELLLTLVKTLNAQVRATISEVRTLPDRLQGFLADARATVAALPGVIRQDTIDAFQGTLDRIRGNPDVEAILTALKDVRQSLGLAGDVAQDAIDAADEIPRDVLGELDTRLDLLRAGERQPGELLLVEMELREVVDGEPVVRSRAFQRVRLRLFGVRLRPRGALLFTDPRDEAIVDQSWEPSPAISYMFHWGVRGSRSWNDVFDPGIGLTATILDYSDEDDFELGLAGSLSLFRSLLWVGYGRNLQLESNFFYVGINPLVVGRLWNERGGISP